MINLFACLLINYYLHTLTLFTILTANNIMYLLLLVAVTIYQAVLLWDA